MKQVKDQTAEKPGDPGTSSGPSFGDPAPKVWEITGTLQVRESELEGVSKDRPLAGIEVKVQASDIGADGPWTTWGVARTGPQGVFRLTESNEGKDRFFRVQARLVGADLTVEDGSLVDLGQLDLADRNWRTIWKSGSRRTGPEVVIGTKLVASGQPEDLGDAEFRRQALIWYVLRTTLDTITAQDPWFDLEDVKALYPARSGVATSYRSGATFHLQTGTDHWHPDTVLGFFWQAWHDAHVTGWGKSGQSFASGSHEDGFAAFATMAITHELWNGRLKKPFNRRYVAAGLSISTLDELEHTPEGVKHGLCLLRYGDRHGWWSHLHGTAQSYPAGRADDDGDGEPDFSGEVGIKHRLDGRVLPDEPHHLSLWDILRTYAPNEAAGLSEEFSNGEVEDESLGLLAFIDRVAVVHGLSDDTRQMLLTSLDPLATKEPFEVLPKA